jgi:hypothetical protein
VRYFKDQDQVVRVKGGWRGGLLRWERVFVEVLATRSEILNSFGERFTPTHPSKGRFEKRQTDALILKHTSFIDAKILP